MSDTALLAMLFGATAGTPATALTISPSSQNVMAGVATSAYTVGVNGALSLSKTIALSDASAGGTFSPSGLILTSGSPSATFTYTPGAGDTSETVTLTAAAAGLTSVTASAVVTASMGSFANLTMVSPTYVAGKYNQGLSGGYGTASVVIATNWSIGFWLHTGTDTWTNVYQTIIELADSGWTGAMIAAGYGSDGKSIGIRKSNGDAIADGTITIRDGGTHYVALGYNSSAFTLTLYVDGTPVASGGIFPRPTAGSTDTFTVDARNLNAGDWIDEVEFYNDLTATTRVPTSVVSRVSATNALWHLDGSGNGA